MLLLKKMPEADLILSVGDMCDRGKDSKKVIEFFQNTPNTEALKGNHEQLMIDAVENQDLDLWYWNGGFQTVLSYGGDISYIPKEDIDWLKGRPLYFETDDLFISHAPVDDFRDIPKVRFSTDLSKFEDFIWNRYVPKQPYGNKFMVYGHNGRLNTSSHIDGTGKVYPIAQCIDNSHAKQLAGMHWPTKEIFTQDYL